MLHQQRVTGAAAVAALGAGKDPDLVLWLADIKGGRADSAYSAHQMPICAMAKAYWQKWLSKTSIDGAVKSATEIVDRRKTKWGSVVGPFTATVATMRRLKWTVHSLSNVVTDVGQCISFFPDPPAAIKRVVKESVTRWRSRRIDAFYPLHLLSNGADPCTKALAATLRKPAKACEAVTNWTRECLPCLRSAQADGQWPMPRLAIAFRKEITNQQCFLCKPARRHAHAQIYV